MAPANNQPVGAAPKLPSGTEGSSRPRHLYDQLRSAVLSGRLKPGERVNLSDIVAEHGVSLSVVREAATRLAEQGLFRMERNRGFWVVSLSRADLEDLTFVRSHLESLCLARSIERGGLAWEANIVAAHHVLVRYSKDSDAVASDEAMAAHAEFHAALLSACAAPRALQTCRALFDAAEIYRHWSMRAAGERRDPHAEHLRLMQATLERDVERATEELVGHITATSSWLIKMLDATLPGDG